MDGWIIGFIVGGTVVLVVVAVLLMMINGARRTAEKTEAIVAALHDARDGTEALWKLQDTVATAERIVAAAADARISLTPGART